VTLFWGGWLRPFPSVAWLEIPLDMVFPALLFIGSGASCFVLVKKLKDPIQQKTLVGVAILCMLVGVPFLIPLVSAAIIGLFWFMFKVAVIVYIMIWFRGTFPRFRYDQLMDIGWKYMIPIGIGALVVNAILGMTKQVSRRVRRENPFAPRLTGQESAHTSEANRAGYGARDRRSGPR